ncbi:metal ABC transporter solute-binding protein, Zn/Mn family [Candidatus Kuenenia stuttgartensis]|uniref:metal ABC transporter solute-binding protein, Zn/Mn family n=1 Tax=Kuenenia stuttgartiensis TaxID=174633 RepID=UPI00146B4C6B
MFGERNRRDYVTTTSIAKPTEDPHFVDAKPSFIVKLNKADLFIEVGMELEIGWLRNLIIGARNKNILPDIPDISLPQKESILWKYRIL